MDAEIAIRIARRVHDGERDAGGELLLIHLARVAGSVPAEARATAWLHEAARRPAGTGGELRAAGLTVDELDALALLARPPSESLELHADRLARAGGEAARLARLVVL